MALTTNDVIRLARKHLGQGTMESSARLCLTDAIRHLENGDLADARNAAKRSLAYSVGILHMDYMRATKK